MEEALKDNRTHSGEPPGVTDRIEDTSRHPDDGCGDCMHMNADVALSGRGTVNVIPNEGKEM